MTEEAHRYDGLVLSLAVPVYCEEQCIGRFVAETTEELARLGVDYEIVFVDDGSTDRTTELIKELIKENDRIRLVEFSYNHGKALAVTAAIQYAKGDYILCMDPDLQNPPQEIGRFLSKILEGYDLVFGIRREHAASAFNVALSKMFWWVFGRVTGVNLPQPLAVMRIFNRHFADRFLEYGEANRFIEGMFKHVGMRQTEIVISQRARYAGRSKFGFRRKLILAINAIFDYSDLPLRLASQVGAVLILLGLTLSAVLIALWLFCVDFALGWPSLFVAIIGTSGLNLFFLGLIGRYVGNIYRESKHRPLHSVRELTNVQLHTQVTAPPARPGASKL